MIENLEDYIFKEFIETKKFLVNEFSCLMNLCHEWEVPVLSFFFEPSLILVSVHRVKKQSINILEKI